jgi:hypothetical protein
VFLIHTLLKVALAIAFPTLSNHAWTVTNFLHGIITLYVMHWVKGASFAAPFWAATDGGKYDKLTWWEQVDKGQQNTMKKKLLTLIPLVLGVMACYESDWNPQWVSINAVITFAALLGKMPFMDRARIFGINQ